MDMGQDEQQQNGGPPPPKEKEMLVADDNGSANDVSNENSRLTNGAVKDSSQDDKKKSSFGKVWKLYLSRLLTAWGDRLWAFGFGLFLFELQRTNLMLLAGYGLAMNISSILLLPAIGTWIDQVARLRAAQILLIIQNTCVIIDCVILGLFFNFEAEIRDIPWLYSLLEIGVMVFAIIANLASHGSQIVVEKDWIVCISDGDDNRLAKLNSNFRTIDLCCQTFAPVLAGLMFSYSSYVVAAVVMGAWNLFSMVAEYSLLYIIYRDYPQLKEKQVSDAPSKKKNWFVTRLTGSVQGWIKYFTHPVRNAGLGLAFLYMTVLGFDNITWGYSMLQCVPEWVLGILVAVSGFCGVAGTRAFPQLRAKIGVERTGVVGMSILVFCISFCVVSIWLPGSDFDPLLDTTSELATATLCNSTAVASCSEAKCSAAAAGQFDYTSVGVMLAGIIVARFGLWIADLSITQILQENVQTEIRGVIGGVQNSLNSTMDLVKYVFVLFLPNAHTFGILILLSYGFVSTGALLMTSYAGQKRKLCFQKEYKAAATKEPDSPVQV